MDNIKNIADYEIAVERQSRTLLHDRIICGHGQVVLQGSTIARITQMIYEESMIG